MPKSVTSEWWLYSAVALCAACIFVVSLFFEGHAESLGLAMAALLFGYFGLSDKWKGMDDIVHINIAGLSILALIAIVALHLFVNNQLPGDVKPEKTPKKY